MTTWTKRWWGWAAAGAVGAAVSGCGNSLGEPHAVTKKAMLQPFTGQAACTDLEKYIEDTAVTQMRSQLEAQRDGVPGWGWWGMGGRGGPMEDGAFGGGVPMAGASGTNAAPPSAPTNFTTTNNQVAGVDEADFVKNDGNRIFVLSGQKLYATKSWPADQLSVQGKLNIEGWPREMFLDGQDKAVVFSSIYTSYPLSPSLGVACMGMDCGYYYSNTTKVTVVDVSDMTNLRVTQEYVLPGNYNSGRKVGSSVRLVISDGFNFPQAMKWYPDYDPALYNDKAKMKAAYDAIIASNETLIRAQTLADWLPAASMKANGVTTVLPHACTDFSKVNAPTRLGTVSVVTLDVSAPTTIGRNTIIAEPGEIYASQANLYVATRHWWWWPAPGQEDTTYIHKFDISSPDQALYVASGTVPGYIIDQFSMDEAASGHFRMATTVQKRIPDVLNPTNWWGTIETTSQVNVLAENAGSLDIVGSVVGLAKGERTMSSRFVGNKGFVVTYRQVDPLFTFDMTDPTHPRKVGELKIPGFSTYLHPIDADHLLTIGTFVPDPSTGVTDWRARALQLAIFDVSDLANPKQTFTQLVGTAYGWSEAQYEHKAFNYFAAKKLLAIPFADWSYSGYDANNPNAYWSSFTSELRVYTVDATTGFTPRGAVGMHDLYQSQTWSGWNGSWTYYWEPSVRRSVMADDFVYAISDSGIRVANIVNLSVPVQTAKFDPYQP